MAPRRRMKECSRLAPFIDSAKAVFHTEDVDKKSDGAARRDSLCAALEDAGFSTLMKDWDLSAWGLSCQP